MAEELKIAIPQEANSHFSGGPHEWLAFIITEGQIKTGNSQMQVPQIPKVPRLLRQIQSNQKCYDPSLVSIGPYHHGKPELRDMEKLKVTFTSKLVDDSGICIEDFYCKVAEVAIDARRCYAEDSTDEFDDEKFTQIMFLDGCFILQFIFCLLRRPEDLKMPGHQVVLVKRDLLLLENQLPFQVIWSLMNLRFGKGEEGEGNKLINDFIRHIRALPPRKESIKKMIKKFVSKCIWQQPQTMWGNKDTEEPQPVHLLDFYIPITSTKKPAAIVLQEAVTGTHTDRPRTLEKWGFASGQTGLTLTQMWSSNHQSVVAD